MARLTLVALSVIATGCSTVTGDAAFRGGHPEQAADLYRRGAEGGDGAAALRLGLLLQEGKASSNAYGSAASWFKKACDLGSLPGCHNVGVAYEYGKDGLPKNYALARAFYNKAAAKGYMQSQYNLGSMYSNNYISPANDVEGLKWLLLARMAAASCKQQALCQWVLNDPPGHKRRLEARLSDTQQQEGRALAARWQAEQ